MASGDQPLRIVLIGKTGAGKSATGNTIAAKNAFHSEFGSESVTDRCSAVESVVNNTRVKIIDTPGFMDNRTWFDKLSDPFKLLKEIVKCLELATPGPHVFLIITQAGRITAEDEEVFDMMTGLFGRNMYKHSALIFTHGDELKRNNKTADDLLRGGSVKLKELARECNQRYLSVNNILEGRALVEEGERIVKTLIKMGFGTKYCTDPHGLSKMIEERDAAKKEKERLKLVDKEQREELALTKRQLDEARQGRERDQQKQEYLEQTIRQQHQAMQERQRAESREQKKEAGWFKRICKTIVRVLDPIIPSFITNAVEAM